MTESNTDYWLSGISICNLLPRFAAPGSADCLSHCGTCFICHCCLACPIAMIPRYPRARMSVDCCVVMNRRRWAAGGMLNSTPLVGPLSSWAPPCAGGQQATFLNRKPTKGGCKKWREILADYPAISMLQILRQIYLGAMCLSFIKICLLSTSFSPMTDPRLGESLFPGWTKGLDHCRAVGAAKASVGRCHAAHAALLNRAHRQKGARS